MWNFLRTPSSFSSLGREVLGTPLANSRPQTPLGNPFLNQCVRAKHVTRQSYKMRSRSVVNHPKHIGIKVLAAEYVKPRQMLVNQRRYIAHNPNVTRNRHFKLYPGENVCVGRKTSLHSLTHGRVKYTHDVSRDVVVVNVLPEPREELLISDLWRYQMEHINSMEENRNVCWLRTKSGTVFHKDLVNPPTKAPPNRHRMERAFPDMWENQQLPDSKLRKIGY